MAAARRLSWGIAIAGLIPASSSAAETKLPVTLIYERYYYVRPVCPSPRIRADWVVLSIPITEELRATTGKFWLPLQNRPELDLLEETFLEYTKSNLKVRAGRMRARFGFNDWSEQWYTPFIAFPLVRNTAITEGRISLTRFDSGIEVEAGPPELKVTAALIDPKLDNKQIEAKHPDYGSLRVQALAGDVMLGANGFRQFRGQGQSDARIVSLDARWATPRWQVRTEWVKGEGAGDPATGHYIDVFYRPEGAPRTQLGLRLEALEAAGSDQVSRLATLGVRQILTPELVFNLNFASGNRRAPAESMRGWSAQLMFAFKVKA